MNQEHENLKALAEGATQGEWTCKDFTDAPIPNYIVTRGFSSIARFSSHMEQNEGNAKFVAAANPKAILALLERLEKVTKHRDALMAVSRYAYDRLGDEDPMMLRLVIKAEEATPQEGGE